LVKGAIVKVHGLKGAAEYNGCIGHLEEFNEEKGRWSVKLAKDGFILGVKPANIQFQRAPPVDDDDDVEGAIMERTQRRFQKIIKKYNLFSEDKAGEIADLLTGGAGLSKVSPKDFATKYGMEEEEAEVFLKWIQMGVHFKEEAIDPHSSASEKLADDLSTKL